jgi:hypothetical protein
VIPAARIHELPPVIRMAGRNLVRDLAGLDGAERFE